MELRKKIYCTEASIPIDQEFNEALEKSSRHVICYGKCYHFHCVCFVLCVVISSLTDTIQTIFIYIAFTVFTLEYKHIMENTVCNLK